MAETERVDVAILGGGLAGLTLALQLRQRFPDLDVVVLERRRHPVPEATHKVGESSVEIAAHYFDTVLGLKDHLVGRQLKKFGFRFFFSEGRRDIDAVLEARREHLPSRRPSYQIDRGIFENFLGAARAGGGRRVPRRRHGARASTSAPARPRTACAANATACRSRSRRAGSWTRPAAPGMLKRQLGLASRMTTT